VNRSSEPARGTRPDVKRVTPRGVLRVARRALPCLILVSALAPFPLLTFSPESSPFSPGASRAQDVVDKMVATINGSELITYTDLLWQLALQPDTPLERPRPEDVQQALNRLVDQRLIAQEGGRLPTIAPKDEDVRAAQNELIKRFPSPAAFQQRIASVGLTAEQFYEIVRQRVEIERYLDFRFRSFVVVTQKEVADYYRDTYVPRFRRQSPGRVAPTLEAAAAAIERTLTEDKIESDTDAFLEDARARAEIVILDPE
jgi:hypothetical protein